MLHNLLLGASALAAISGVAPTIANAANPTVYFQGATAPTGGIWVPDGTGLAGGHFWFSDHIRGFCRMNPVNADNSAATLNASGCIVADGQPTYFDYGPLVNNGLNKVAFIPDGSSKSVGVIRVQLNNSTKLFTGSRTTLNPTLPVANSRCKNNNLAGCRPIAAALAPNGTDLYISTQRARGDIYRIRNVNRGLPTVSGSPSGLQLIGTTEDGGSAQSMAFVGNDLYLAEGTSVTVIENPSNIGGTGPNGLCNTNNQCLASTVGFEGSIPGVPIAPLSVGSDGTHLFVGDFSEVNVFDPTADILPLVTISGPQVFRNISGFAVSTPTVQSPDARLVWGDDPSAGASVLLGTWYTQKLVDILP